MGGVGAAGADGGAAGAAAGPPPPVGMAGWAAAGEVGELVAACSIGAAGADSGVAGVVLLSGVGGGCTGACIPGVLGPAAPLRGSGLVAAAPCGPCAPWVPVPVWVPDWPGVPAPLDEESGDGEPPLVADGDPGLPVPPREGPDPVDCSGPGGVLGVEGGDAGVAALGGCGVGGGGAEGAPNWEPLPFDTGGLGFDGPTSAAGADCGAVGAATSVASPFPSLRGANNCGCAGAVWGAAGAERFALPPLPFGALGPVPVELGGEFCWVDGA